MLSPHKKDAKALVLTYVCLCVLMHTHTDDIMHIISFARVQMFIHEDVLTRTYTWIISSRSDSLVFSHALVCTRHLYYVAGLSVSHLCSHVHRTAPVRSSTPTTTGTWRWQGSSSSTRLTWIKPTLRWRCTRANYAQHKCRAYSPTVLLAEFKTQI